MKIAKEESYLKEAHTETKMFEETIQHLKDDNAQALTKLHSELEASYEKRLSDIETKNLAEQKSRLAEQKAAYVKESNEQVAVITAQKAKAEKEEQELAKKVEESTKQINAEKEKIVSLTKAKKDGDEFKRQVLAQRQSLAQSESKLTELEAELDKVHADYSRERAASTKKLNGLSQQLAEIKTTEAKDSHKLTALHQVV